VSVVACPAAESVVAGVAVKPRRKVQAAGHFEVIVATLTMSDKPVDPAKGERAKGAAVERHNDVGAGLAEQN